METKKTRHLEKSKRNAVENKTDKSISNWQRKVVIPHARAGIVHFHIYSMRALPVTTDRLIKMIKLIFDRYTHIPFDIEISKNQLQMLLNAYCQPLSPDSNEPRIVGGKIQSMENLLMLLRGTELKNLHVYVLSSLFTFCYFLKKHKEDNNLFQDAYQRIKTGSAVISLKQIQEIVALILPKEKSKLVSLEGLRSVFRKGSSAQMRELLNSHEYLLSNVDEEQEICMKFYFHCLETNCKEVAPSRKCHVFYNEVGETLFIHSKKLMTEAEIDRFGEEPGTIDKKGIDGNEMINENVTVDDRNKKLGSRDENYSEKSGELIINEDFPSTHGNKNIPMPADNVETDEAGSNHTEEPSPVYSDLTSNEIDSSEDELPELSKRIDDERATNLSSVTAPAVTAGTVSSPTNEQIPSTSKGRPIKGRTAATKPSSTETSSDETSHKFPLKKMRRVVNNRRKLTTPSSTMESQALAESNIGILSLTQLSDNPMDTQPPAVSETPDTKTVKNTKKSKKKIRN